MQVMELHSERSSVCREVLDDLPEWFGRPEAKERYITGSADLPMLACIEEGRSIGFISIKAQTEHAAELYVLGIKREYHRQGLGRQLCQAAVDFAKRRKFRFLTVKTIGPGSSDPFYAKTRAFYESMGFLPLETFPTFWGETNPCLLMVLPL